MVEIRRLAAILAADVVGYSRLMSEDEAGTARAVREHRDAATPIVSSHGGRLVKTMGDGVLLEFPSVVAAVECAIAIQAQMVERNAGVPDTRRILYRIGVNLGDVLIDGDDILGDGVNIAARLESIAEPGGICISGTVNDHVRGRITAEFIDLGEKTLKNIARPVRVYSVRAAGHASSKATRPEKAGAPRFSIVVLPLANLGGDAEQDYFVDGVTESLTTDLSRVSGMLVIGRNTAFTYKGKAVDLKQAGRDLNVRYALEGSVQRAGSRMRVNVQLIDAENGVHLWAERFDKPLADLFEMQDEIVARLANTLKTQLITAEARRAEQSPNPDSLDLYFQGMACFNAGWAPRQLLEAHGFFERASILDPSNLEAFIGMVAVDCFLSGGYMVDDRERRIARARENLTKVLARAPSNAYAHYISGLLQLTDKRPVDVLAAFRRSLQLDPNLAVAHAWSGFAKCILGRAEEAEGHVHEALRLSPRDTNAFAWIGFIGTAKLYLGFDEEAVYWYRRSIEINPNYSIAHFSLAASLANLDRLEEAKVAIEQLTKVDPDFTIRRYRIGAFGDDPVYLAQRERVCVGLRKAGLADQ